MGGRDGTPDICLSNCGRLGMQISTLLLDAVQTQRLPRGPGKVRTQVPPFSLKEMTEALDECNRRLVFFPYLLSSREKKYFFCSLLHIFKQKANNKYYLTGEERGLTLLSKKCKNKNNSTHSKTVKNKVKLMPSSSCQ